MADQDTDMERQPTDDNAQGGEVVPMSDQDDLQTELIYEEEEDQGVHQPQTRSRADKASLLLDCNGTKKVVTS